MGTRTLLRRAEYRTLDLTSPTEALMRQAARVPVLLLPLLLGCASSAKQPAADGPVDIGYGTADRGNTTGAVHSADADDMRGVPYTRVEEMIAARFPGVSVRANPDGTYTIRIRGETSVNSNNDPLVVVDGVPAMNVEALAMINPREVERIDVLRDGGSTAIYGSRGANGVILIRTKQTRD